MLRAAACFFIGLALIVGASAAAAQAAPPAASDQARQLDARFKAAYSRDALKSYRVKFAESYISPSHPSRRISLQCEFLVSGERFIHTTRSVIKTLQGEKVTHEIESWDGKLAVWLAWPEKAERDKERTFTATIGAERRGFNEMGSLLEALELSDRESAFEPSGYEPTSRALALKSARGDLSKRVYFADERTLEFTKIERLDAQGRVYLERAAEEWRKFGDLALPTVVRERRRNKDDSWFEKTFRIESLENDVKDLGTDFIVELPGGMKWAMQDSRKKPPSVFLASNLDPELMRQKRYAEALDAAFAARAEARARAEKEKNLLSVNPPTP